MSINYFSTQVDDVQRTWNGRGMQSATPVSKDQRNLIRVMAADHDLKTISELTKVPYANVRQIVSRAQRKASKQTTSQIVTNPVEAVANRISDELVEHERETRLSLAKSTRRMAKDCENLKWVHADKALTVAKTMAIVHRQDEQKGQAFTLNVLNMGELAVQVNEGES